MERDQGIGFGYVIVDWRGRIVLDTLRRNRRQCWIAFIPKGMTKDQCVKEGYRAIPVWIKEHRGK